MVEEVDRRHRHLELEKARKTWQELPAVSF